MTQPTIQQAIRAIAGQCDGARTRDDVGFNGRDTAFGKSLAAIPHDDWSEKQLVCAHRMLATYRQQLAGLGIAYDAIRKPVEERAAQVEAFRSRRATKTAASPYRVLDDAARRRNLLQFPFDARVNAALREVGLKPFKDDTLGWVWPLYPDKVGKAFPILEEAGFSGLEPLRQAAETQQANLAGSSAIALAGVEYALPKGKLRPFQSAGVAYATRVKRVIIADQPGLGKTVQALAAIDQLAAYPMIVVPPASLKLNWKLEVEKWGLARKVEILAGRKAIPSGKADIYVANYELLKSEAPTGPCGMCKGTGHTDPWNIGAQSICDMCDGKSKVQTKGARILVGLAALLKDLQPRSIVFDESHYLKERKSQRSQAAKALAEGVDVVLLLTGTPVKNRPSELIHPLDVLGHLQTFGGFRGFTKRYCAGAQGRFGYDASGASNLEELHERLRATCMIRRTKDEVLKELPPKVWSKISVPLSNLKEYQAAEANFLHWLLEHEGTDAAIRAERAETLVRISKLRTLAATGKVEAARSWAEGFVEAGEKLVLFAHHQVAQDALLAAFEDRGAVAIRGGDSPANVEAAKASFSDPDGASLIVCSLLAGGLGHTLHAGGKCSSVAFVEFGWTPADMEQAEDRIHRYGQTAESVNVYHLVGEGAGIDEEMAELLEEKRAVIDQIVDGAAKEAARTQDLTGDLIERLRARAQRLSRLPIRAA